jgi:hypothetical protein
VWCRARSVSFAVVVVFGAEQGDDEAVRQQLAELQEVRDRVALLRQWLDTGGPGGDQSSELDRILVETAAQCGSDEPRFMEILTEKLFGDLSITAELKQRAGIDSGRVFGEFPSHRRAFWWRSWALVQV